VSGTAVLRRDYRWGALGVVAAGGIGVSSVLYPVPTVAGATVVCSFVYALMLRRYLPGMFLVTLGILLLGYASLGRGFAYLGMAPVYVGEMTLAFGLVATALSGQVLQVFRSPVAWLIVALSGWCALQTIPYVPQYGVDALRDAAEWGYGVFALMVAACMLVQPRWEQLLGWFRRCMPYLLVWTPLAWIIVRGADDLLPVLPGTDVKLVVFNHALVSVHLAGAAAFTLLGFGVSPSGQAQRRRPFIKWLLVSSWTLSFLIVASITRSGLLAVATAVVVVGLFRPLVTARKLVTAAAIAASTLVLAPALFVGNLASDSRAYEDARRISLSQIGANFGSIVGKDQDDLTGTRTWRLEWWRTIVGYTLFGDYFWTGKGFGISLAEDDGFETTTSEDRPNRSPHNGHLTILARSGVPGAALWTLLHVGFAISLIRSYFRARLARNEKYARLAVWVLAYWSAFIVQSSFDVFLEGPPGGISFWTVCGLGITIALQTQRLRRAEPRAVDHHGTATNAADLVRQADRHAKTDRGWFH